MCMCGCVLNIHSSICKLHTANTFSEDTICRRTHWGHIGSEDRLRSGRGSETGSWERWRRTRDLCTVCAHLCICATLLHKKVLKCDLCIVHTLRGHVDLFAHCTCLFNPGLDHSHWAEHTCEDPTPIQRGNHSVRFVHIHSRSAVFGTSAIPGYSRREAITCLVESTLRGLLYSYIHP